MELDRPIDVHNGDYMVRSVPKAALTPPTSDPDIDMEKDGSSSELSDLELDDDDIGEIEPDHYFADGEIPVFKPVSKHRPVSRARGRSTGIGLNKVYADSRDRQWNSSAASRSTLTRSTSME